MGHPTGERHVSDAAAVSARIHPAGRDALQRLFAFRLARFLASSGLSVLVGTIVLIGAYSWLGWPAPVASLASFFSAALVSYVLLRGWTFSRHGRHSLFRDVLPYSVLVVVSLALSTGAAQIGAMAGQRMSHDRSIQGLAVLGAVLIANVLFVPLRYLACRWIFHDRVSNRDGVDVAMAVTGEAIQP